MIIQHYLCSWTD